MKKFHTSSTERGKCYQCNKTSGTYCTFVENGISIVIPTCDKHYNTIDANEFKVAMKLIKQTLKLQG